MTLSRINKREVVGLVIGERWLTLARLRKGGPRQSIQVVTLCQRPIHTHDTMSIAQQISSFLIYNAPQKTHKLFIYNPFIALQLPQRLYQQLTLTKPPRLQLTGHWAAAVLADAGYQLNEWHWDAFIEKHQCSFLLLKVIDQHNYLQSLQRLGHYPQVLSYLNIEQITAPASVSLTTAQAALPHFSQATVLADPVAAEQAIALAFYSFKRNRQQLNKTLPNLLKPQHQQKQHRQRLLYSACASIAAILGLFILFKPSARLPPPVLLTPNISAENLILSSAEPFEPSTKEALLVEDEIFPPLTMATEEPHDPCAKRSPPHYDIRAVLWHLKEPVVVLNAANKHLILSQGQRLEASSWHLRQLQKNSITWYDAELFCEVRQTIKAVNSEPFPY